MAILATTERKVDGTILTYHEIPLSAPRIVSIACTGQLDSGELLSGTPTITEVTTSVLSITNKAITTADKLINDVTIPTAQAITCLIDASGATVGTKYRVHFSCLSDSTPAQTISGNFDIKVIADS